jgi:hypothetical protein
MLLALLADGIDIFAYLSRAGSSPLPKVLLLVVAFMLANYVLNVAVVGLPAVLAGGTTWGLVCRELIVMTLLGQIADRVGALLAFPLGALVMFIVPTAGIGVALLFSNFLLSGMAVGALAFHFLRRRWDVPTRLSWIAAIGAAVLANPAWVMLGWLL